MNRILSFLSLSLVASLCWASVPSKKSLSSEGDGLAMEILSMPEANRHLIAKEKSAQLYPELLKIAQSETQNMNDRWKALTLAAYIGQDRALADLQKALKAKEWYMRNAALVALKAYHPLKAPAAARELLKDKALVVRSAAVDVLGPQLDGRTRDLLWEELSAKYNYRGKQSLWIRPQILKSLAENPDPKESPLFVKALKDKDPEIYSSAVVAMEKLTQQKLGAQKTASQKKELWIQWVKAHPQILTQ